MASQVRFHAALYLLGAFVIPIPERLAGMRKFKLSDKTTWPELLTVDEVAWILDASKDSVNRMVKSGELVARRYSDRTILIFKDSLLATPPPDPPGGAPCESS